MKVEATNIPDVVLITPIRHADHRGYFSEVFKDEWFRRNISDASFVQDNQSSSTAKDTVRGLHFQIHPFAQGKLVRCIAGAVFDVAVDIRLGSPTYGKWVRTELTAESGVQLWLPPGFAHGYATLCPGSVVHYKVTAPYSPAHDKGIRWNDPSIDIPWPVTAADAILSEKDKKQPFLMELSRSFFK